MNFSILESKALHCQCLGLEHLDAQTDIKTSSDQVLDHIKYAGIFLETSYFDGI